MSLAVLAVVAGCGAASDGSPEDATQSASEAVTIGPRPIDPGSFGPSTVDAPFVVTGLAHKCIDFGGEAFQAVGTPVFLYGCNGTVAQNVRVVEIADGTHDVSLRAGTRFCLGVHGGVVATGQPLELQTCDAASQAQRFALDGDAIYVGTQTNGHVKRDLVIEVAAGRGANHTPLVVGARDVDDAEDFRFAPTTSAAPFPHSGFTTVASRVDLDRALYYSQWGTVMEVTAASTIYIDDLLERKIGAGVTLRGERKGMQDGPEINRRSTGLGDDSHGVFLITGDNVRITGLRFRGPSASLSPDQQEVLGVRTDGNRALTVDHNELSAWPGAAVRVLGGSFAPPTQCFKYIDATKTQVVRNYIHDNSRQGLGYGVETGHGGQAIVLGNTFDHNRHSIASDGDSQTGYTAISNLVLHGNRYSSTFESWREQDFDIHGTLDDGHNGGWAGGTFLMQTNSFYDTGKNVDVRGTPCTGVYIHQNVFVDQLADAIIDGSADNGQNRVQVFDDNIFSATQSATTVGDFDGDGVQDDFIATGAAWYYRPGRTKEWRFLRTAPDLVGSLTFGDFDGDGRTDVRKPIVRLHMSETSWGGSSPWDLPLLQAPPIGVLGPAL